MADILHQELIRQAVEAARAGDRQKALDLLKEVLEDDEENIKAWLLLARLTENEDEKRLALATVLQLDPGNARAQAILEKLDAKVQETPEDQEVIPGVTLRQLRLAIGVIIALVVVGVLIIVVVNSQNARREEQRERDRQEMLAERTNTAMQIAADQTQIAMDAASTAVAGTETRAAEISPTPTPKPTSAAPTLPPTPTPTPSPEASGPDTLPPPPAEVRGIISGWSGFDTFNVGGFPVVLFRVNGDTVQIQQIGSESTARDVMISPVGNTVIYTRYDRQDESTTVYMTDLNGEKLFNNLDSAATLGSFFTSSMPFLSEDGQQVVFIGDAQDTGTGEIYLLQLSGELESALTRITNDGANYRYPALSPDGTRVVAVQEDPTNAANPGPDLVVIDIETQAITTLTLDNAALIESSPRWSPDGTIIAFAAAESPDGPRDLYIMIANSPGAPGTHLITDPSDDAFPVYSPDGNYLAFSSNRLGQYDLYILDLLSFEIFQVTNSREEDYPGYWIATQ